MSEEQEKLSGIFSNINGFIPNGSKQNNISTKGSDENIFRFNGGSLSGQIAVRVGEGIFRIPTLNKVTLISLKTKEDELPPSVIFNQNGSKSIFIDRCEKEKPIERYRLVNSQYQFDGNVYRLQ